MKHIRNRLLSALCVLALAISLVPAVAAQEAQAQLSASHTVWVVGDSTVCHYDPEKDDVGFYYKRVGYGDKLSDYLTSDYTVKNLALSGRSSLSFLSEDNYTTLKNGIQSGDILIIGFGHNDEKNFADRYTSPTGDYTTDGSFAKCLYDNYVKLAKDKGAIPVVCTPIVRHPGLDDKGNLKSWGDSLLHIANGGSYPEAALKMCQDTSTASVDLTGLTKTLYDTLEASAAFSSTKLHSWTQDEMPTMDTTHINAYGAKWVAYLLAKSITESSDANVSATLKEAFTLAAGEPTAADLAAAATVGWVKPVYAAPDLPKEASQIWQTCDLGKAVFYGTAFGSLGGAPSTEYFVIEHDGKGSLRTACTTANKGKVASSEEGFVMYFIPVPATSTFTFRAKATFNGFADGATNPNQAAFGLTARDAIWIDQNDKALMSDYVVAGTFGDGSANCFRRKAGKLEKPATFQNGTTVTAEHSYNLSIVGTSDGYTCQMADTDPFVEPEAAQSGGYDYKLTGKDADYVYLGMFVSRSMDVTYSDIYLEVDGEVWCDTTSNEYAFDIPEADDTWKVADGVLETISTNFTGNALLGKVLVAVYHDGALAGLKMVAAKNGQIAVGLPLGEGDTAKVFSLKPDSLTPWTKAFSHTVPTSGGGAEAE